MSGGATTGHGMASDGQWPVPTERVINIGTGTYPPNRKDSCEMPFIWLEASLVAAVVVQPPAAKDLEVHY